MPVVLGLAPELIALLATALMVLILAGLLYSYRASLGWLLQQLANLFRAINVHVPWVGTIGLGSVADAIDAVDANIRHGMAVALAGAQHGLNRIWHYTALTLQAIGESIEYLGHETLKALHVLRRYTVPALLSTVFGPLSLLVYALGPRVEALAGRLAHLAAHAATVVEHNVTHIVRPVNKIAHYVYVTAPVVAAKAVAIPWGAIHKVEREATALEKWVKAHAKYLTVAGISALLVAALAKEIPGYGCKNNKNLAKHLCGWPIKALEDLLAGVISVLVLTDICKLMGLMNKAAFGLEPFIVDFNAAINRLACYKGYETAGPLDLSVTDIPPVTLALKL